MYQIFESNLISYLIDPSLEHGTFFAAHTKRVSTRYISHYHCVSSPMIFVQVTHEGAPLDHDLEPSSFSTHNTCLDNQPSQV